MNLNVYDKLDKLDKTKTWYCPKYKRLYSREVAKQRNYNFYKRWNEEFQVNDYFIAFSDVLPDNDFRVVPLDNFGRIKLRVPDEIIQDSILRKLVVDTNISIELVDAQVDGKVYRLNI